VVLGAAVCPDCIRHCLCLDIRLLAVAVDSLFAFLCGSGVKPIQRTVRSCCTTNRSAALNHVDEYSRGGFAMLPVKDALPEPHGSCPHGDLRAQLQMNARARDHTRASELTSSCALPHSSTSRDLPKQERRERGVSDAE
jgi:hypothetical protein